MKNINVDCKEIQYALENQYFETLVELSQNENFDLVYLKDENKYSLNLSLNFSFFNPLEKTKNKIDVKIPVEFESEENFDARELYIPYFSGYMAVRNFLSQRFINLNIGFQPAQFLIAPLAGIELKLYNAIKEMERVQNN